MQIKGLQITLLFDNFETAKIVVGKKKRYFGVAEGE